MKLNRNWPDMEASIRRESAGVMPPLDGWEPAEGTDMRQTSAAERAYTAILAERKASQAISPLRGIWVMLRLVLRRDPVLVTITLVEDALAEGDYDSAAPKGS